MKMLRRDIFEREEFVDAGIVDEDVEPAEGLLRFCEEPANVCFVREVRLNGDCLAAIAIDLADDAIRALFAGAIVDDHRSSLGGQMQRDGSPDSLGSPGHD